jgi:hypothetical protein
MIGQGLNETSSLGFIPLTVQGMVRRRIEPSGKPIGIAFPQVTHHYSCQTAARSSAL